MEASNHSDHSIGGRLRETTSHLFSALVGLPLEAANLEVPGLESWEQTQPSCGSAREETAPGGAQSSPLKRSFPHKALGDAVGVGVVSEVGSAGCLTAGTACGEKMRADSEGSLSMGKQMCSGSLDTFQFEMFGQTFCLMLEEKTFLLWVWCRCVLGYFWVTKIIS